MASTSEPPVADSVELEPRAKKAKVSESSTSHPRVVLNPADCDLDFNVGAAGLEGSALHDKGFAYCWSGARATVGITRGKYFFGCKIISAQEVNMEDIPAHRQHECCLGISRGDDKVGNLGETENSFGFDGTGKFSTAGKFSDYGEEFGVGDTIVCAVNLEKKPFPFVRFSKDGKWSGRAKYFIAGSKGPGILDSPIRKLPWESALFPHVSLKNVVVHMQFSLDDGLVPKAGYKPWASALEDGNAIMGPIFHNPRDCEVRMMVGLPASGKSTWAEKWMKEHPEKQYLLLGTNLVLERMKCKKKKGEGFYRQMGLANGIFNTLLLKAAETPPRNYILDQTNVYKSARIRKIKNFAGYQKIAVVVFPEPQDLMARARKRFEEMGKGAPAEVVNEMLANYDLPMSKEMRGADEYFDEVIFTELTREESNTRLDDMKLALARGASVQPQLIFPEIVTVRSSALGPIFRDYEELKRTKDWVSADYYMQMADEIPNSGDVLAKLFQKNLRYWEENYESNIRKIKGLRETLFEKIRNVKRIEVEYGDWKWIKGMIEDFARFRPALVVRSRNLGNSLSDMFDHARIYSINVQDLRSPTPPPYVLDMGHYMQSKSLM